MQLNKLYTLYTTVLTYFHNKFVSEKFTDYFSVLNNKDQGTKSLSNCLNVNNVEYHIFYDISSVDNTVNCVAIKKDYLIDFCNHEVNKQFPELCSKIYNRLSHTVYPEFKKPLNFPLTYRDLVIGGTVMVFMRIYQKLEKKSPHNININNMQAIEFNNAILINRELFENQAMEKLAYKIIAKSPIYMKNFIEYIGTDNNNIFNLTHAINSFEEVTEKIAIKNQQLFSELSQKLNFYSKILKD